MYTLWAEICVWILNVFFNFAFVLESRTAGCFRLEPIFAQDVSMLASFPSGSSSLCFLSGLSILALFVFFPLTFFGLQNTSPSPFRTGSYEQPVSFFLSVLLAVLFVFRLTSFWTLHQFLVFSSGSVLFCAPVSFVFRLMFFWSTK